MAAKTLIRSGASIATRFLNSAANSSPSSTQQTLFSSPSKLFLSHELSKSHPFQFFPHTRQNDAVLPSDVPFSSPLGRSMEVEEKTSEIAMNIFPFGHPSLDFFLPDASDSSDDPMILFPKRTFQPSTLRRKRVHGFFARKATKGGRRVIQRRIAKGRYRITA